VSELVLVGAGLFDERDLSRRALDDLQRCRTIFAEEYTAILAPGSLDRLAADLDRPVVRLDRAAVENPVRILEALADPERSPVALIVAGDPFAATTHVALRVAAEEAGHRWTYRPNASILTAAAGFLGLMPYRFGRPVSLPFPEPGFAPTSPLEGVASNRASGWHTLILLDLRPAEGRFLTGGQALDILEERDGDGRFLPLDARIAVAARVGSPTAAGWVGARRRLREIDFGPPMHVLVALAPTLHFEEEAALAKFSLSP
jgi:diphthine synthase